MELSKVLQEVTSSFEESPFEINNGCCEEWAEQVLDRINEEKSAIYHDFGRWDTVPFLADTNHSFIYVDGRFYDAECLEGVEDYMQLPIFKKLARNQPVVFTWGNYNPEKTEYNVSKTPE